MLDKGINIKRNSIDFHNANSQKIENNQLWFVGSHKLGITYIFN